jgi:hypothetical protein
MPVMSFEVTGRDPVDGGRPFGDVGPYERVRGTVRYSVDPQHEANAPIVDLDRAPRGADGRVEFASDLVIFAPADATRSSGRLLVDVPNRGRVVSLRFFNRAEPGLDDVGDGWLFRNGWTLAVVGWQHDVPTGGDLLGLQAPEAGENGQAYTVHTLPQI